MWRMLVALSILLTGCISHPMSYNGDEYVGIKYMVSPLGEGIPPDSDPLIRFDGFDCTTFVETVLARGNVDELTRIRYRDGEIGFLNRNHFIESDWLVNNVSRVKNVSSKYAKSAIRHVVIDKRAWFKKVHNIDNTDFAPVAIDLEYIPYGNIGEITNSETLIVLFVTDNPKMRDIIGTDLAVVHMGLLLPGGVLRHASSAQKKVVDVSFTDYIKAQQLNKNNIGITLVEIK